MKNDYVIWRYKDEKYACALKGLEGVENDYEILKGISLINYFPNTAVFRLDPDYPNDTLLLDSIFNIDKLIIGSSRLKDFFESRASQFIEYLPVNIIDHKDKPIDTSYFIINPITHLDCIDLNQSEVTWGKINPNRIQRVARLVIDYSKVDATRDLFRMAKFSDVVLVKRNVARAIDEAGFTGIRWLEISDYPEK